MKRVKKAKVWTVKGRLHTWVRDRTARRMRQHASPLARVLVDEVWDHVWSQLVQVRNRVKAQLERP